jgi:PucR C-terminal helix-turn-helix domain/GGDEF-like domain
MSSSSSEPPRKAANRANRRKSSRAGGAGEAFRLSGAGAERQAREQVRRGARRRRGAHAIGESRVELAMALLPRLQARRDHIEALIVERCTSIPLSQGSEDEVYEQGRCAAVAAMLQTWFSMLASQRPGPPAGIPQDALAQGRRAARLGIGAETFVHRVFQGHDAFRDTLVQEALALGVSVTDPALAQLGRELSALFELLVSESAKELTQEREQMARTGNERRLELVRRMLAGEEVDAAPLGYDFEGHWHLAVIATGATAGEALGEVAVRLELSVLCVQREEQLAWAWLGSRRELPVHAIERLMREDRTGARFATGEPGFGISGWRRSHRLAQSAARVASRNAERLTRLGDAMVDAALLADWPLAQQIVKDQLSPLDKLRMGGPLARETLRAYLACERNAAAAAARMGVDRRTISYRLRQIEEGLGAGLGRCLPGIEAALRLDALGVSPRPA